MKNDVDLEVLESRDRASQDDVELRRESSKADAFAQSLEYFNQDELATNVVLSKYLLRDKEGVFVEKTPDDIHHRLASEFARMEAKFGGERALSQEHIYQRLRNFRQIVPQGSPQYGIGNNYKLVSLSNCVVVPSPEDSISSIADRGRDMANLMKRRCGVGIDISNLRPDGALVGNSAGSSTGAWSFADFYSYICRMIGQCIAEGERVLTKRGSIPIETVTTEDSVWTRVGWVSVDNILNNGEKETFELKTEYGFSIKTSADHIFLTENDGELKEKRLKDFSEGDSIILIPGTNGVKREYIKLKKAEYFDKGINKSNRLNREVELPEILDEKLSYLIGYSYGDGNIEFDNFKEPKVLSLACSNDWEKIKNKIKEISHKLLNYDITVMNGDGNLEKYEIYSKLILQYLQHNELLKQKSEDIYIPEKIWVSPISVQAAFLSGYFDADGYASGKKKGYVFSTVSNKMAQDVQLILMNMGVVSKIKVENRSNHGWRDLYSVAIVGKSSQEKFVKLMYDSIKVSKCNHVSKRDCYLTPYRSKNLGVSHNKFGYIPDNSQYISAQAYERVRKEAGLSDGELLIKDTVSTIVSVGNKNTYDLVLPKEHLFSCQGFDIHNSGRRGALMISIDVRHPDVEKFIEMKHDLTKVTGANVSVKIRDDFMNAVENDEQFELRWPIESDNPTYQKTIRARDVWNKIVKSATQTAEPGILMWDNILKNLPAEEYKDYGFKTVTVNPCGEICLSGNDSCRLIAINLVNFVKNPYTQEAYFDFEEFSQVVSDAMRLSDDLVELEVEKLTAIIDRVDTDDERELWGGLLEACIQGRRTGLGTLGLGDTMARLCLPYDASEAIEMADRIYGTLKESAYRESVELAKERGAFPIWNWDLEYQNAFLQTLPEDILSAMSEHGRRNISILTNAPTGSTSIEAQTSSGIEPIFRLSYSRMKKINHDDHHTTPDFVDDLGDKWQKFTVYHHAYREYLDLTGADSESPPDFFVTSDQIDWEKRVDMQAAIQRHIDHSISSTINLPAGTTTEVADTLYRRAWKAGLKGVTIYVDGSRTGVLVTDNTEESEAEEVTYQEAPERPLELRCEINRTQIKGEKWVVLVGMMKGKPYEIFAGKSEDLDLPSKFDEGVIIKNPRKTVASRYDLRCGENGSEILIKDIIKWFKNDDYGTVTRLISMNLRHGVPIHYIVEQMQKDGNDDLWSFHKVVARVLKKYIPDGTTRDKVCPQCGTEGLTYQEGCLSCTNCGYAKCG